jgi:hypothetical protein
MRQTIIFSLIIILTTSCDKTSYITFEVENRLSFPIKSVSDSRFSAEKPVVIIQPESTEIIAVSDIIGKPRDYVRDTLFAFYSLQIYAADTLLIKKYLLTKKEWEYKQTGDRDMVYLLIIDKDDLK